MKNFLIVEPGSQSLREQLVRQISELDDIRLIVASGLHYTHDYDWVKPYVRDWIHFSYSRNNLIDEVKEFQTRTGKNIDGVLTYMDASIHYTNELAHELKLPVISQFRDRSIRNKAVCRQKLQQITDSQPWFRVLKNEVDLKVLLHEELTFPLIVKPAEMTQSLGVTRVESKMQLKAAYLKARNADFWNKNLRSYYGDMTQDVLVESYIEGPEYSVEVLVQNGQTSIVGITKTFSTDGEYFDEVGHCFPAPDLSDDATKRIEDLVRKTHAGLMLQNTFTNMELRLKKQKPYLMELNCRLTSGQVNRLMEKSLGVSTARMIVDLHSGKQVSIPEIESPDPYEIRYLNTKRQGRVISQVKAIEEEGVDFERHVRPGEILYRDMLFGESRLGHVIFPHGKYELGEPEWERSVQSPVYTEKLAGQGETLFVFQALPSDLQSLVDVERRSWREMAASMATIQRRFQLNPEGTFFAMNLRNQRPLGLVSILPMVMHPEDRCHQWEHYAELAVDKKYFEELKTPNGYYIVSLGVDPDAPRGVGRVLLRAMHEWGVQQGMHNLKYGIRTPNYHLHAKLGLSFKDYYEGLLSRKFHEDIYKLALDAGGTAKGFVKDYYQDPPSKNYGIIIEHDLG